MALIGNRMGVVYFGQVTAADTILPDGVVSLTADRTEAPTADNSNVPEWLRASSTYM